MPQIVSLSPRLALASVLLLAGFAPMARGQEPDSSHPYNPKVEAASDEAAEAVKRIRVPEGLAIELFAAEPLLANPVAFCVDERGRFYVAETFRHSAGVTDTRGHMNWLDDDLACRTVEDRVAMYRRYLGDQFAAFRVEQDRLKLVEDRNGDGKADHATVFADGFTNYDVGIGAGVLARGDTVWYTCIPDLWRLRDADHDGRAEERTSLHHGYGVHVGFLGHDLHGLRIGPDGKLYFSIGDRGFNVMADGKRLAVPDTGSVLRCNLDGSELEVFATGLRNPQELAFDQYGNLFTGDNNSDGGDRARWVYLLEGGDSGWRMGYQYIESPASRGPWNAEKLWYPHWEGQAAHIVPPLANLADGPSGLAFDPGTGLPDRYRNHFFLCDFRGSSGQSGIHAFALKPKGAGFEVVDQSQFAWSVLATDVDFGPDGGLYFTDWVEGWNKPGKGRIYRVIAPEARADRTVQQVRTLLAEGFTGRSAEELAGLLKHPDMRVRQEAQFALAARGEPAVPVFQKVAAERSHQLARLHAIWGLGQVGRKVPKAYEPVAGLLTDDDAEVRAQAARIVGDGHLGAAYEALVPLLKDKSPRVRLFAAMSLGKLGRRDAVGPLLSLLKENGDQDPFLRHAGVIALVWIGDRAALLRASGDASPAVRMAVLLAMRRLESPEIGRFLGDSEPRIVLEAARAINDVPLDAAMPALAELKPAPKADEALLRRILNANVRVGREANAQRLAGLAANGAVPTPIRREAIEALGHWAKPPGRDRVVGLWRPLPERPAAVAAAALKPELAGLFKEAPAEVQEAAAVAAGRLGLRDAQGLLEALVRDNDRATSARVEALKALEALNDPALIEVVRQAVASKEPRLRAEGRRLLATLRPAEAVRELESALRDGSVAEKQGALAVLGSLNDPAADATLSRWLDQLLAGKVPPAIQLDLVEAAGRRPSAEVKAKLQRFEASKTSGDPLVPYRLSLEGGDSRRGATIFFQKAEVSCLRCHKVRGRGGEVGPDLTGIGARQNREYLLESIVTPNRQIAQGFETLVVATSDGQVRSGILKAETDKELQLMTPEGKTLIVPRDEIEERKRGASAMPEDVLKSLSKAELRDLVEFLASLK